MTTPEVLALLMFALTCGALMAGYSVAFTLSGVSLVFAAIGIFTGQFDPAYLLSLPGRIFPIITREILLAVPLFVFMGVMLEKSRIAEDLLENMGELLGPLRGGMGVSVIFVGALLAASTGIVGATVVTMGLISLPTLLRRGYDPALASGAIAASGTLGQIIPPSIVLVTPDTNISQAFKKSLKSMLPPILLIFAVLGSILSGYATPTKGAALGALGAVFLAAYKTTPNAKIKRLILVGTTSLVALILLDLTGSDLRLNLESRTWLQSSLLWLLEGLVEMN